MSDSFIARLAHEVSEKVMAEDPITMAGDKLNGKGHGLGESVVKAVGERRVGSEIKRQTTPFVFLLCLPLSPSCVTFQLHCLENLHTRTTAALLFAFWYFFAQCPSKNTKRQTPIHMAAYCMFCCDPNLVFRTTLENLR